MKPTKQQYIERYEKHIMSCIICTCEMPCKTANEMLARELQDYPIVRRKDDG